MNVRTGYNSNSSTPPQWARRKYNEFADPTNTLLLGDYYFHHFNSGAFFWDRIAWRHTKGMNILYFDLHVARKTKCASTGINLQMVP